MKNNFDSIKEKIIPVLRENHVTQSSVFGSYASGEEKAESDIDILVEFEAGNEPDIFTFLQLKRELENRLGRSVDLVTSDALSPFIRVEILKNAKVFYAKS